MDLKTFYTQKTTGFIIVLAVILVGAVLWRHYRAVPTDQNPPQPAPAATNFISISKQDIKEENFTGTIPVISGSGPISSQARAYIDKTVAEFRKQANEQVPDIRAKFGASTPSAAYEIDIDAQYIKGAKTESIVIRVYNFTGGAHGWSFYKVMTADRTSGKILALSDVIKADQQNNFTELVKKELNDWRPDGMESAMGMVFPDSVRDLKFGSFANWSFDDNNNLIIYFDQYAIGAGALGEVEFPLPFSRIKDFLNPNYL